MNIDRRIRKRVKTLAMSLVLTFAVATPQSKASAQGILPKPQSYAPGKGTFLTRGRQVRVENRVGDIARNIYSEPWMAASKGGARQVMIFDRLSPKSIAGLTLKDGAEAEAYQLHVSPDTILIRAASADGFRLAWATVRQLTTKKGVACCDVVDAPAYKWRSMMLDVSRHFRSIDFLKRQIDAMARYKFNRLHLHLTDAAGWRIEIKRYPRLTSLAAWRPYATWQEWTDNGGKYVEKGTPRAYGGYYTHYFSNDDNPEYHRRVTGPQIYKNAGDAIDAIVIGVGSGGTITGVAEYIKAWNSMVRIVAVEPAECDAISGGFIGQHGISGIGPGFVPENYNPYVVDTVLTVTTADAERAAREVLFFDGVPACTSAGATLAAAVQLLGMGKAKRPLCVFAGRHIYG